MLKTACNNIKERTSDAYSRIEERIVDQIYWQVWNVFRSEAMLNMSMAGETAQQVLKRLNL